MRQTHISLFHVLHLFHQFLVLHLVGLCRAIHHELAASDIATSASANANVSSLERYVLFRFLDSAAYVVSAVNAVLLGRVLLLVET